MPSASQLSGAVKRFLPLLVGLPNRARSCPEIATDLARNNGNPGDLRIVVRERRRSFTDGGSARKI